METGNHGGESNHRSCVWHNQSFGKTGCKYSLVCGTGADQLLGYKTGHVLTADNLENRFTSRYMDIPNTPLYPFGFGLSYTEFDISDVEVRMEQDKRVHVHCKVSNKGNVAGAEVVQCYYETLHASVVRPQKELVRFQKVFLDPGEKKNVDFYIDPKEFSYYDKNMEVVSTGMKLRISVGNSSDHEWGSSELYI